MGDICEYTRINSHEIEVHDLDDHDSPLHAYRFHDCFQTQDDRLWKLDDGYAVCVGKLSVDDDKNFHVEKV